MRAALRTRAAATDSLIGEHQAEVWKMVEEQEEQSESMGDLVSWLKPYIVMLVLLHDFSIFY